MAALPDAPSIPPMTFNNVEIEAGSSRPKHSVSLLDASNVPSMTSGQHAEKRVSSSASLSTISQMQRLAESAVAANLSPSDDSCKRLITLNLETQAMMRDLQRQVEINTQLLQSMLDVKGDDTILEICNLPANDLAELISLEDLLKNDKAVFAKLVSILLASTGGLIYCT